MATLEFGLNVKSKPALNEQAKPPPKRAALLDDDSDEEADEQDDELPNENHGEAIGVFDASAIARPAKGLTRPAPKVKSQAPTQPPSLKNKAQPNAYADLSSDRASKKHASVATDLDSSIYDYDAFHEAHTSVSEARKQAERKDAIERKPKYINNLLDAASRRKQDQLVAKEKLLQKEREAEGDEFADKEKFVTGAYKLQQAEAQRIEAEEKKKAEEEDKRKRALGGGMQNFYRGVMADNDRKHREAMEAAQKLEQQGTRASAETGEKQKTDVELAAELKAKGVNVVINEEGQVTDKRQLLSAGLNVAPAGQGSNQRTADHLKTQARPAQQAYRGRANDKQAMRDRQTKMIEQQLEESAKRAADEEAEEQRQREHAAKSRKTQGEISSAKERYLARKREAEEAKKRGEA